MTRRVLLLPGDYIGQEIVPEAAARAREAVAAQHGLELSIERR
jgi:isocitrate/isopropylmalate dehydrogenase